MPTSSASTVTPIHTSASDSGRTSASAPRWPASRVVSSWAQLLDRFETAVAGGGGGTDAEPGDRRCAARAAGVLVAQPRVLGPGLGPVWHQVLGRLRTPSIRTIRTIRTIRSARPTTRGRAQTVAYGTYSGYRSGSEAGSACGCTSGAPRPGRSLNAATAPSTATPAPAMHATRNPLWNAVKAIESSAGRAACGAWATTAEGGRHRLMGLGLGPGRDGERAEGADDPGGVRRGEDRPEDRHPERSTELPRRVVDAGGRAALLVGHGAHHRLRRRRRDGGQAECQEHHGHDDRPEIRGVRLRVEGRRHQPGPHEQQADAHDEARPHLERDDRSDRREDPRRRSRTGVCARRRTASNTP